VDIVLNRWRSVAHDIGQILETHLAGGQGPGAKSARCSSPERVVSCASSGLVYNETGAEGGHKSMTDPSHRAGQQPEEGVPMATPCSTAREEEIKSLLRSRSATSGQTTLHEAARRAVRPAGTVDTCTC